MRYGFAAVCTLLLVVGGRLVQLQGLDHTDYAGAAAAQRVDTVALHALRGSILDRFGTPMAFTSDAQDITADPAQIPGDRRLYYAQKLAPLLGVPEQQLVTLISGTGEYSLLATALSPSVAQRVMALNLVGVYEQATTARQYPGRTTGGQRRRHRAHRRHRRGRHRAAVQRRAGRQGRQHDLRRRQHRQRQPEQPRHDRAGASTAPPSS